MESDENYERAARLYELIEQIERSDPYRDLIEWKKRQEARTLWRRQRLLQSTAHGRED